MSKVTKYLSATMLSSVMIFTAANAAADVTDFGYNTKIQTTGVSPITRNSTSFSISENSIFDFTVGYAGSKTTAYSITDVMNTLWKKTSNSSWSVVWGDFESFASGVKSATSSDTLTLGSGTYKFISQAFLAPGTKYSGSYFVAATISPVPEPETYALMGVGLAAVLLRLRKKKVSGTAAVAV